MSLTSVIDTAMSQVGISEYPPNSNKCKYNTEYYGYEVSGAAYPWCVTFLWWVFKHSGEQNAFYGGNKTASSTQLMNYYQNNGRFITNGYQVGDIVFFNFTGGSGSDHVEIIVEKGSSSGLFVTVGGNTTPGNEGSQYNGGTVARKTRYSSQFLGGARPAYSSVPSYDYYNPNLNPMEQGTISTTGSDSSSSNFIRTNGYISFPYEGRIVINSNLARGNIFFYNSSYSRISYSSLGNLPLSYTIPEGTEYIRIVLGKSSGVTAPEDFEYLSINVNANSQVPFSKIIKATAKVLSMHSIVPDSVAIFQKKPVFEYTIRITNSMNYYIPNLALIDGKISWGDGESIEYNDPTVKLGPMHAYTPGTYKIKIYGILKMISFYRSGNAYIASRQALISIDTKFPETMSDITSYSGGFYLCTSLISVPSDLFYNCPLITDLSYCFRECFSLTSIPSGLFDNCTLVQNFASCFYQCTALTSIPSGLFDSCSSVLIFSECFFGCYRLTSIPSGLFDNCTLVQNFASCFYGCDLLTTIPSGLFDNCSYVTSFYRCFYGCYSLTTIPSGLFDSCTSVTSFYGCFFGCTALTSIPSGLFDSCSLVTTFYWCFGSCYNITSIPSGLFNSCSRVTTFYECFQQCSSIMSVPFDLFDSCSSATNFTRCFIGCRSIVSAVPELWNTHPNANGTGCYKECTNAVNYSDIPSDWK